MTIRIPFVASLLLCLAFNPLASQVTELSGIINSYARVLDIDYCSNTLLVDEISSFVPGENALLMQMNGAAIETSNSERFGSILDYGNAGNVEVVTIASVSGNRIHLRQTILQDYDPAHHVQLITFPRTNDAIVTGRLQARAWDGSTGGVIALDVAGTLTLRADIDATGAGFRGGSRSRIYDLNQSYDTLWVECYPGLSAWKGESIASRFMNDRECGRGAAATGGGGGNMHNAGGGGGAHAGSGGKGGGEGGWGRNIPVGGIGGYRLDPVMLQKRVFLGAGGGGGHQDNWRATSGGSGGGIVLLRAERLDASGYAIRSNGIDADTAGIDGAGGGGAGGTVWLDINTFIGRASMAVHGGSGGSNHSDRFNHPHPTGGGGGGGAVLTVRSPLPQGSVINVNGGAEGQNIDLNSGKSIGTFNSAAGARGLVTHGHPIPRSTTLFTPLTLPQAPDHIICAGSFGQRIGTSATGGYSGYRYRWHPSAGLASDTTAMPHARTDTSTIYICSVTDSRGCIAFDTIQVTVIESGLRVTGLEDGGILHIDTTRIHSRRCQQLSLRNVGVEPLVIHRGLLPGNLEFSLPPSQFPLTIPPGAGHDLTICFAPQAPAIYTDTLTLDLDCTYSIPLRATSPLLQLTGATECGTVITLRQVPDSVYALVVTPPFPNPSDGMITVQVVQQIPEAGLSRIAACALYTTSGRELASGEYRQEQRSVRGEAADERGRFLLDTSPLPSGYYLLRLVTADRVFVYPVVLER